MVHIGCSQMPPLSGSPVPDHASPEVAVKTLTAQARYPAAGAACATPSSIEHAAVGRAKIDLDAAATPATRFALGSITKAYTATWAALLVQDGIVGWDTRVFDALPAWAATSRPAYANVTLKHLLAHRAGLPEFRDDAGLQGIEGTLVEQRAGAAAWGLRQEPINEPGTADAYSSLGFIVAAALLERASAAVERAGEAPDYETSIHRRLLAPLGSGAGFGVPGERASDISGHERAGDGWRPVDAASIRSAFPEALNPTGLLMATMEDHARFLQLHLRASRGAEVSLLSRESAATLHTPMADRAALGWLRPGFDADPDLLVHNGTDGRSYMAFMALSPRLERACVVAVNGWRDTTPSDLRQALVAMLGFASE